MDKFAEIVGRSAAMAHLLEEVERVAVTDVTVFIGGESGSGKELVARALHSISRRKEGPLLALNCGAITDTLQDSELFGHERGAFTGAQQRHLGVFERANGGTVLLDEVGELSHATQVRLLRVLQERKLTRVGGDTVVPVDIRVISASNRDLNAEVAAGRFRMDLFYRLVVYPLWVPPLRARTEDVPILVNHFLESAKAVVVTHGIVPEAVAALQRYSWPGNVRELENVVKRMSVQAGGEPITLEHLPMEVRDSGGPQPASMPETTDVFDVSDSPFTVQLPMEGQPGEMLEYAEKEAILATLLVTNGRVVMAARKLGVSRATLYRKLNKFGIDPQEFREVTEKMDDLIDPAWRR